MTTEPEPIDLDAVIAETLTMEDAEQARRRVRHPINEAIKARRLYAAEPWWRRAITREPDGWERAPWRRWFRR